MKHNRRSIRLRNYDYSQKGVYFITICTHRYKCILGKIINSKMCLNKYGEIVKNEWLETIKIRPNIALDKYIIMPNHIHGIIIIVDKVDTCNCRGVLQYAPTEQVFHSPKQTIGAIVRGFKSASTKKINLSRHTPGQQFWQRNYYEHIISYEEELDNCRAYIYDNPLKWEHDKENPANIKYN